jgi:transcriptional regulator with PAS, ATPase and Fis domain
MRGSFTGAVSDKKGLFKAADGGTIFFDEIGTVPIETQAKLLRVLQEREFTPVGAVDPIRSDVRVVAATNADLPRLVSEGRFREDLYYRLCVIPLNLPPLRARPGDLKLLAEHFLKQHAPRGQRVLLTPAGMKAIEDHAWPGNVRELRNVIFRALLLRKGQHIDASDLSFDPRPDQPRASASGELECTPGMTLEAQLARAERLIIESALKRYGSREKTARELDIGRSTLFKRLKEWGLQVED